MITNYNSAVSNIRKHISAYIKNNNITALILGISGGVDSALTAALVRPICDELNIPLIGRSIPIQTNKPDEISRAKAVGQAYCHDFKETDLTDAFLYMQKAIPEDINTADKTSLSFKLRMGNLKARIRMQVLYDLASQHRGMVLTTDNYTEYLLGFWTLHGDVGDWAPIQNLWKTEVYEMSTLLVEENSDLPQKEALQRCIDAVPTDGLGITNSDLEQIKAKSYQEIDQILIELLKNPDNEKYKTHPVAQRHFASAFKRKNPYILSRKDVTDVDFF